MTTAWDWAVAGVGANLRWRVEAGAVARGGGAPHVVPPHPPPPPPGDNCSPTETWPPTPRTHLVSQQPCQAGMQGQVCFLRPCTPWSSNTPHHRHTSTLTPHPLVQHPPGQPGGQRGRPCSAGGTLAPQPAPTWSTMCRWWDPRPPPAPPRTHLVRQEAGEVGHALLVADGPGEAGVATVGNHHVVAEGIDHHPHQLPIGRLAQQPPLVVVVLLLLRGVVRRRRLLGGAAASSSTVAAAGVGSRPRGSRPSGLGEVHPGEEVAPREES